MGKREAGGRYLLLWEEDDSCTFCMLNLSVRERDQAGESSVFSRYAFPCNLNIRRADLLLVR
jgi:hypothetical protein